jgi:DNA-binding beta-propeller fold protein YncE
MFDPATHTVYTGNNLGATLSVLNVSHPYAAHPAPLPRVAVGTSPYYAAVDHANHTIYVTNSGNGTVSILPEAPARSPSTANTVPALGHRHEASESRRPSRRPSDARDVSRGAR